MLMGRLDGVEVMECNIECAIVKEHDQDCEGQVRSRQIRFKCYFRATLPYEPVDKGVRIPVCQYD